MADNKELNAGSGGATVGTDEILGVDYQRIKIILGADGVNDGDVATGNPMPISGTVDLGATDNAVLDAIVAGQLPDGHAVTVDNAAGAAAVNIQDGGNSITVDGTVDLGATDNAVLDSIAAATAATQTAVEILDNIVSGSEAQVDVITVPADPFGVNADAIVAAGAAGSIQAKLRRLTSDMDAVKTAVETLDNVVAGSEAQVDVVTSALPTGAATAANQSTGNTALSAIQTAVETLDNIVSGSEAQVDIVASLPAGTNNIGDVDVASIAAGANLIGDVGIGVRTSGGVTPYQNLDVDESEDAVKASAGQVYFIHAINLSAAKLYLKFYNATVATVAVGTTTPVLTFPVPTLATTNGQGFVLSIPNGIAFGTAITIAATTGFAVADTGAPGANELIVNIGYA